MNARVKRSAKLMQHAPTQKVLLTAIVTEVSQKKKTELARMTTNAWKRRITVTRTRTVKMRMGHFLAIATRASQGMGFIVPVRKPMTLFNQTLYSLRNQAQYLCWWEQTSTKAPFHQRMLVSLCWRQSESFHVSVTWSSEQRSFKKEKRRRKLCVLIRKNDDWMARKRVCFLLHLHQLRSSLLHEKCYTIHCKKKKAPWSNSTKFSVTVSSNFFLSR